MKKARRVESKRQGRCYELAIKYLVKHKRGTLVHARVWSPNLQKMIDHALVEIDEYTTYEPVTDRCFLKPWLYARYTVEELKRYSVEEVAIMVLKEKNYGPWHKEAGG